jgi:galactonate dehydratase
MKVVQIDTIHLDQFPNLLFVEIHTDEGLVGLGETYFGARAVEAYLHETVAPYLIGRDPLRIEEHARALRGFVGYSSSGAETRGNSAIDIALWDLLGQASGQPLYQLLGGASRDDVRIYNTCAGYRYVRGTAGIDVSNWGLEGDPDTGPYEDLEGFLNHADRLAESLLSEGITGMKIWPFDLFAAKTSGHYISRADLDSALEPIRKIRGAVGSGIEVMVELHGLWDLPTAAQIGHALDEFDPYWIEDPIRVENMEALSAFTRSSRIPVAAGETLAGMWSFQDMMERRAADVVMLDIGWLGGITEARKIAALAEAKQLSIAPHDCTGPIVLTASTHLSLSVPNALLQETVRAFYTGWYTELVTQLPPIHDGRITPPVGPGLGTALRPEVKVDPGTQIVSSGLQKIRMFGSAGAAAEPSLG